MKSKLPEKCISIEESQEYFMTQSQFTQPLQTQKQSLQRSNEELEKCNF